MNYTLFLISLFISFTTINISPVKGNEKNNNLMIVSDKEIKSFLLTQKIDINKIWDKYVVDPLTSEEISLISSDEDIDSKNFDNLPSTLKEKLFDNFKIACSNIANQIDERMKVSFFNKRELTLKEEKNALRMALCKYFSIDSFSQRINKQDEYLLDPPGTPFEFTYHEALSKDHFQLQIKTFEQLSQSDEYFEKKIEKEHYFEEIPKSFTEKHPFATKVFLYGIMASQKLIQCLTEKPDIYRFDKQAEIDDQLRRKELNTVCPNPAEFKETLEKFINSNHNTNKICSTNENLLPEEIAAINLYTKSSTYIQAISTVDKLKYIPLKLFELTSILLRNLSGVKNPSLKNMHSLLSRIEYGRSQRCFITNVKSGVISSSDFKYIDPEVDECELSNTANINGVISDNEVLKIFNNGLNKIRSGKNVLYHGVPRNAPYMKEKFQEGDIVSLLGPLSATEDPNIAIDFSTDINLNENRIPLLFTIYSKDAKPIAEYSLYDNEKEHLIKSNNELEVIRVEKIKFKELCQYSGRCNLYKSKLSKNDEVLNVILMEKGR